MTQATEKPSTSAPDTPAAASAATAASASDTAPSSAAPSVVTPTAGRGRKRAASGRRLWQIPLLIVGLAAFGFGVRAISKAIKPVPFETHAHDIRALIAARETGKAIEQINKVSNDYGSNEQLGTLSMLAGDAYFVATREESAKTPENWKRLIEHYETGRGLGVAWTVQVHERVGEAAMEMGNTKRAMEEFETVTKEEPASLPRHARTLVSSYLASGSASKAHDVVEEMLALKELDLEDRVWGLCSRIELALGLPLEQDKAVAGAKEALKGIPERDPSGTLLTWIGRAEFEAGKIDEARKDLYEARSRFVTHTTDDGRAALLLGKIAQVKGELPEAMKQFQEVIQSHPGSTIHAAARLGRAEVLAAERKANAMMETDYVAVMKELLAAPRRPPARRPEMVKMEHVSASLLANYQAYQKEDRLDDALKFLMLMKATGEPESAANVYREATTEEARADELLAASRVIKDPKEAAEKKRGAIKLYSAAADAYLRHADLSTLDDVVSGASLWKAAALMDRAGRPEDSLKVYERYTVQRPRDPRTAEGLFAMGDLYQSLNNLDKAIEMHLRNRKENPKSPASYRSTAQLARCYMAKGPEYFKPAEEPLLDLVQDNANVLPIAAEFRTALFTLGELYYRWAGAKDDELAAIKPEEKAKWEAAQAEALKYRGLAILRLEEARARYGSDPQMPRVLYWLAECYRKSGGDIATAILREPTIAHRRDLELAREQRVLKAAGFYQGVVDLLDRGDSPGQRPLGGTLEEEYLRYSHLNRAACYFELEQYGTAIKLYDAVATRYAQTVTAVEAYIQIVRAYGALKEPAQAAAAAERARWVLKRIPDAEFGRGPLKLTREYYEKVLVLGRG